MKDGVALLMVCVLAAGGIGWLVLRANGIHPFQPKVLVLPPTAETRAAPKNAAKPKPLSRHTSRRDIDKELAELEASLPAVLAQSSPMSSPPPPFPFAADIQSGVEKTKILAEFGTPTLAATTADRGHVFETFVYRRKQDQLTIIHFEDGKVSSVHAR